MANPKIEMRCEPALRDEIESMLLNSGDRNELGETITGKGGKETISEFTRTAWALLLKKRRCEIKGRPRKEYRHEGE